MTAIEKVRYYLSQRELLEQLAEECNELGKASLKIIRASKMNNNYTPITEDKAIDNFREELSDVLMCVMALNFDIPTEGEIADNPKWKRWTGRLELVYDEKVKEELKSSVRCKCCSHYNLFDKTCRLTSESTNDDFSCSNGERIKRI